MEKVHIRIPEKVQYSTQFRIAPDDINEANHMGNERILLHANRIRYEFFHAVNILPEAGHGLIIANHGIQYRSEGFSGDTIHVEVSTAQPTECSFDLVMHFIKSDGKSLAVLRSGLIYFDYGQRKIRPMPDVFRTLF